MIKEECWKREIENEKLIDFFERYGHPIEQEDDLDPDLVVFTHGGIIGCVLIKEEEEGLLERGWEKEEIWKLEEGEPRGASHKHSSSSSCIEFRIFIDIIHM